MHCQDINHIKVSHHTHFVLLLYLVKYHLCKNIFVIQDSEKNNKIKI